MPYDANRGRDLPRAPKFKPVKDRPKSNQIGDPIKLAKRRARVSKALAKATNANGFDTLFAVGVAKPEKSKQKEYKLVLEALALGLPVHSGMIALHGLQAEPNPPVPQVDWDEEPF